MFILPPLGLCPPERPHYFPPSPAAPPLVFNRSSLEGGGCKSTVSWFEQVFFAPTTLLGLYNATVTHVSCATKFCFFCDASSDVRFGIVLPETDDCTHEGSLRFTLRIVLLIKECAVCRNDWMGGFLNSFCMRGSTAKVCLVAGWNCFASLSRINGKLIFSQFFKKFPAFLEVGDSLPQGRTNPGPLILYPVA
jgi:hypothetical protein